MAYQNSFAIHVMPYDGDCTFSSVAYQLQANCVCNASSSELRQNVADCLKANATLYHDFLCQPVPCSDNYNADTEQPTPEDEYINSTADTKLQTEFKWQRCLRHGAWDDHITLQPIAIMFSVKISVLSSYHPMFTVTPKNCSAECEIFVGLILQHHYVGLDKLPVCELSVEKSAQANFSVPISAETQ